MTWPWRTEVDARRLEHDLSAERRALRDLSSRLQAAQDDLAAMRASLVERTHERDVAVHTAQAAEAKFTFCADALAYERQRNKDLADRIMALTDRRSLQVLRGEAPPAPPIETEPPRPPRAPIQGLAGNFDPSKVDIEALFRMPD